MASGSRLLGRNMALYLDGQCRDVLLTASSVLYGYQPNVRYPYGDQRLRPRHRGYHPRLDDRLVLPLHRGSEGRSRDPRTKNVPRLGETYVAFVHPHQSRRLRDNPEFIEVTKYAAPGNFMLGEIGRLYDTVFIETTQVSKITGGAGSLHLGHHPWCQR
jgi:N4-gp56 family major capsid protein